MRLVCLLAALLLSGCETLSYYGKGVAGQVRFYGAREPIPEVLERNDLDADVRRRLQLVPEIRAFAKKELQLPVEGQYRDYVQLDSPNVAWNVFAAPELSLDPYRWCYLLRTLCMEYRGYFSQADARAYADKLAANGYDTHVGGVSAFSSLGLLDDPVTSVLTSYPDDVMALVLFHELAHAVLYVQDDTGFNESFAEAVAEEGLRRWLRARGQPSGSSELAGMRARQELLTDTALAARGQLAVLYGSALDDAEKRRRKADILQAARTDFERRCQSLPAGARACEYAGWFGPGLNNARLNAVATYQHRVPAFTALLRAHATPEQPDGDLAKFFRTVKALGKMPPDERTAVLQALAAGVSAP